MNARIILARLLLRVGEFLQSLPVVVMRPDDLIEFGRQSYEKTQEVESWVRDEIVDSGLSIDELELLGTVPAKAGNLLLLGLGGGREAIPLARMGFRVTGVDYVPAMVERAKENADHRGIIIEGLVQEISQLNVERSAYDVVWLSRAMYSSIPTRPRRVSMARLIGQALKPGGLFLCQFRRSLGRRGLARGDRVRRAVATSILGNLAYEPGDKLWLNVEFIHEFGSPDEIRSELEESGLTVLQVHAVPRSARGWAVCTKMPEPSQSP